MWRIARPTSMWPATRIRGTPSSQSSPANVTSRGNRSVTRVTPSVRISPLKLCRLPTGLTRG